MALFYFLFPLIFFILIIIAPYYIISGGLRLLKISEVPKSKVFIFYLLTIIIAFMVEKFLPSFFVNALSITSSRILYKLINNSIYLIVNFLLLKYYFQLSGKKLLQFWLYLIIMGLIFSALISLPAIINF